MGVEILEGDEVPRHPALKTISSRSEKQEERRKKKEERSNARMGARAHPCKKNFLRTVSRSEARSFILTNIVLTNLRVLPILALHSIDLTMERFNIRRQPAMAALWFALSCALFYDVCYNCMPTPSCR